MSNAEEQRSGKEKRSPSLSQSRQASRASLLQSQTPYKSPLTSPSTRASPIPSPGPSRQSKSESPAKEELRDGIKAVNSDFIKQLKEADKKAADTSLLIMKMRNSILKISEKTTLTAADNDYLQKKQKELMEKLNEFEDATRKIQTLIGLGGVRSSEINEIPIRQSLSAVDKNNNKKGESMYSSSFEKFNEDCLPKVIVCGVSNADQVPKIIICESSKQNQKRNSGRPVFQQYPEQRSAAVGGLGWPKINYYNNNPMGITNYPGGQQAQHMMTPPYNQFSRPPPPMNSYSRPLLPYYQQNKC